MIRIQMLKQHRAIPVGHILEQTDGVAEYWIRTGKAIRLVPDQTVEVEVEETARERPEPQPEPQRKRPRKTTTA
ncbi:MAG TPA: hypothetical protein VMY37_24365 [Thermoguttaceae bacterium]|nr:hypothetical protein [Thermoguttaceae bacterium]